MLQILQDLRTGEIQLAQVPRPQVGHNQILIQTTQTLISAGTEKMLLEFGQAGWIDKARQQPDKVRMVFDKIKTDGLIPTAQAVKDKLDNPLPLGYCNVGRVLEIGKNVVGFGVGDRVVSNGPHAEIVASPTQLSARVPDSVTDEQAVFSVLAAIGLQGIRLAQPTLGESFVVTGIGLIGLLTVQLLRANGCRVLGLDYDERRLSLARALGAETHNLTEDPNPLEAAQLFRAVAESMAF